MYLYIYTHIHICMHMHTYDIYIYRYERILVSVLDFDILDHNDELGGAVMNVRVAVCCSVL